MIIEKVKILIIDDNDSFRNACAEYLKYADFDVTSTDNAETGLKLCNKNVFKIVFVDYKMPGLDGIEFLLKLKEKTPDVDVVIITGYATIEMAVEAIKHGAYDYIPKPFHPDKLKAVIDKILEKNKLLNKKQSKALSLDLNGTPFQIIGNSPRMQEIFTLVQKVAPSDSTILILGESGTGKELIAKAIHANSHRRKKMFYTMDCGSLVESLFESELFGHVKGSFTGAIATKHGSMELAHGGTFFFDEIGNISNNVQAKILRAIQEKEIRRVGSTTTIPVDVRVISATNLDLRNAVEKGTFREDLYYRISVVPIYLPPLRERKEDIPLLIDYFIKNQNVNQKTQIDEMAPDAQELFMQYNWPGNIRELENAIERAILIEESPQITLQSLPKQIREFHDSKKRSFLSLSAVEKEHIINILTQTKWNISKAAKILEIDRKSLYAKIKKYQISR